jgi:coenzyme F420 hydrogenase subunit beta
LLELLGDALRTREPGSSGKRKASVAGFKADVERAGGGLEFARAQVAMTALETERHLRRQHPRRLRTMTLQHVWRLVAPYGVQPRPGERQGDVDRASGL